MNKPLILALDIGTSSVRAALYDAEANPLRGKSERVERSFMTTADGGFELDADTAFEQVVAVIDAIHVRGENVKREIECVATSAFWHSIVGVDDKGKPTTPILGWADTRSRNYTPVLRERFDAHQTHSRTGAHFHSSYWPAKLLWLRATRPGVFAKTAKWLSFSDYVALKLFGEATTSVSMASGTGIFDIRKCEWDSELIRFLKVSKSNLPTVAKGSESYALIARFAKRWPRLREARWFLGVGDGAADNIGAGCVAKDRAALMIGTSGAMRAAYTGEPPNNIPDGLFCYRIDRTRVVVGGALSDGGNLYQWIKSNLNIPKNAEDDMRRRGAAAHGLTVLPFFFGERSTGYNENATGAVLDLNASHDATDILQAAMEAVGYRFAEILDQLRGVTKIKEIVASGGALRDSPVWKQIIADVLGRDLVINNTAESSMRGAVLLALESLGRIEASASLPAPADSVLEHHPKCHAAYSQARRQHQKLYRRTHK